MTPRNAALPTRSPALACAAFRNDDALEVAAWRREWPRRTRNNNVCVLCGYTRDGCVCPDKHENYAPASGDADSEGAPA